MTLWRHGHRELRDAPCTPRMNTKCKFAFVRVQFCINKTVDTLTILQTNAPLCWPNECVPFSRPIQSGQRANQSTHTILVRRLAAGHQAVTELDDLRHADDGLRMVAFVRQQHQKVEDLGNEHLSMPANKKEAGRENVLRTWPRKHTGPGLPQWTQTAWWRSRWRSGQSPGGSSWLAGAPTVPAGPGHSPAGERCSTPCTALAPAGWPDATKYLAQAVCWTLYLKGSCWHVLS